VADNEDETSMIQRPRTIMAAVVAVIVLGLVAWLVLGRGSDNSTASSPPISPSPTATTSAADGTLAGTPTPSASKPLDSNYDSACGLKGGTTTVPRDSLPDVTWRNVSGWYLPSSTVAGPGTQTGDGPWSCFARTPTGAILAGYTIAIRLGIAPQFNAVVTQQTVPGVGQAALLKQGPPKVAVAGAAVPKGFLVDSYTNDDATVTYYLSYPNVGEFTCSSHVQWFPGSTDWLLRLESNGDVFSGCVKGAPGRYVPWGPAS